MSRRYQRWREAAEQIFNSYGVPLRRSYTVRQIVRSQELRDAIRDTFYLLYRHLRRQGIDRMDEAAANDQEATLLAADYISQLRAQIVDYYNEGLLDEEITIDPSASVEIDPSRVLNLDAILNGSATWWEFEEGYDPYGLRSM